MKVHSKQCELERQMFAIVEERYKGVTRKNNTN
jgi:hypothetical protein